MNMRRKPSRIPDVLICLAALVGSFLAFNYLHGKWYYGGWMSLFGDPPTMNPAYKSVSKLFLAAPFAAAGLVGGLLAGISYFADWQGIILRLCTLGLACFLLNGSSSPLGYSTFLPISILALVVSSIISWLYGVLLLKALEKSALNRPE